jgi:hypothetical protein
MTITPIPNSVILLPPPLFQSVRSDRARKQSQYRRTHRNVRSEIVAGSFATLRTCRSYSHLIIFHGHVSIPFIV